MTERKDRSRSDAESVGSAGRTTPSSAGFDDDLSSAATFMISVAAELAGMHAQTLRTYDRLGLVTPERTSGGGRRYSSHDVEVLREIQRLSQEEGVNLAGIKRIIELTNQVDALQQRVLELQHDLDALRSRRGGELVPVPRTNALVVWQPRRRRSPE